MSRALRVLVNLRKRLNSNVLRKLLLVYYPTGSGGAATKNPLLDFLEEVGKWIEQGSN